LGLGVLGFRDSNILAIFPVGPAKGTKREKMATERLNDIGFRVILIPFFGIAIPVVTRMIDPHLFGHWSQPLGHWMLKLAYAYTIGIAFVIWQGNRYLLFSLRSYFDWFNRPVRKIIALLLAISFFTIPVCVVLLVGWYHLFNSGRVNWDVLRTATLIILICVIFITHVYETVFLVRDSESEMLRNAQLERLKAQAELEALKAQIDPHFMFNSLNTLTWLIEEAPAKAKVFNEHLADVYRYILRNRSRELVLLGDEVGFLYDYFALMSIRYGEAVRLRVDLPEEMLDRYMVLPISLQVLAENAHKHNEFSVREPLEIFVSVAGERVVVRNRVALRSGDGVSGSGVSRSGFSGSGVSRSGTGLAGSGEGVSRSGVGLANLDERCRVSMGVATEVVEAEGTFAVYLPILGVG
jgi:sensor histidine kinase YesM